MCRSLSQHRIDDTSHWRWQLTHAIARLEDLPPQYAPLLNSASPAACDLFPFAITPYYLSLIDPQDPRDPIARQCLPTAEELRNTHTAVFDPIDEERHTVLPGLIQRYPDRALLLLTGRCATYCRHCTRRAMGAGRIQPLTEARFQDALRYLRQHPEIRDVILSGGDPLLLDDEVIVEKVRSIRAIPSVDIIRIATRLPVTLPMRITPSLARQLAAHGPIYINTHFNHPRELTPEAIAACAAFVDAGIPVNNQSVLLKGVNDDPHTLAELLRGLLRARVRPYYLFMCDPVAGTAHFRVPLSRAMDLMDALRGKLSGLAIPTLVVDLPGGLGKIPVERNRVLRITQREVVYRAPDNREISWPV
ncbi:MAG: KamA family radical SAM protein [Myxococcales bacterium]|jgi:lysine 2,3-aminomutase|nr:KamA family radical SAM protein [Myxococcales bacterium]